MSSQDPAAEFLDLEDLLGLVSALAGNHALVDGNKRLALLATAVFLRINGYRLDMTDDEAFDLTVSVAAGQLDAAGIEKRLRLIVFSDDA
jgi:death-on-curing protein